MTIGKIGKAFDSIKKLAGYQMPIKKARAVYLIYKDMEEQYQFAIAEDKKYIDEFHGEIHQDGSVTFKEEAEAYGFEKKHSELNALEIEWKHKPVKLSDSDLGTQQLSPADIMNLDGFVVFE